MATLPLIPKEGRHQGRWHHTQRDRLPAFYMNDFTRLGLRVHPCDQALQVLEQHRYGLSRHQDGYRVAVEGAAQLQSIVRLLENNGVVCEMADVADQIYQG
ncbi:MAG: hypothetical protein PVJ53_04285 [Desulfobacterales bacterium]|jgi:hypothetical protein